MRHEVFEADFSQSVIDQPLELAVIIPTFNESKNVEPLLERLSLALAGISWEAVFVDDNSPDGTADLVRFIGITNRNVRVVHRFGRRGLSSAVIEGMLATSAPILAVIDGDMQHDEAILPQLFERIASGQADLAIGTRYSDGGSVGEWDQSRHRASQFATQLGQWALKTDMSDPMSGFFAISRASLMAALPKLSGVGFKILLDIACSSPAPLRTAEIPYCFRVREAGESKIGSRVVIEYLALLADKTIGRIIPLRLLSFLIVGGLGVGVHLSILGATLAAGVSFLTAQVSAVVTAMTFNFFLNNLFTYRDRQLRGWKIVSGLASFYAVCSVGAAANIGIGTWVSAQHEVWWLAGLAGVAVGVIWNFAASSFVTWRK
ncbi:MAG: glycosyltransferase [Sphingomonadaceae bacterium]